ncbi:MAG: hypothetical protein V3U17_04485, partial [Thermoplasmata archaeon]
MTQGSSSAATRPSVDRGHGVVPLPSPNEAIRLEPPSQGKIPVAFLISQGVTVIDFAGPWEVFQDVYMPDRGPTMEDRQPFGLYTVSDTTDPVTASAGLKVIPDHTFET